MISDNLDLFSPVPTPFFRHAKKCPATECDDPTYYECQCASEAEAEEYHHSEKSKMKIVGWIFFGIMSVGVIFSGFAFGKICRNLNLEEDEKKKTCGIFLGNFFCGGTGENNVENNAFGIYLCCVLLPFCIAIGCLAGGFFGMDVDQYWTGCGDEHAYGSLSLKLKDRGGDPRCSNSRICTGTPYPNYTNHSVRMLSPPPPLAPLRTHAHVHIIG